MKINKICVSQGKIGRKHGLKYAVKYILSLFATLLFSSFYFSLSFAAFEDLGAGARGPGMGNAFVAIADDVYALYYNPAGLALVKKQALATSYARYLMGLSDNSNLGTSFIGYVYPLKEKESGLGINWQQFNLGGLYQERSIGVAYGSLLKREFGPGNLYGGINLNNLSRSFNKTPEADNALDGLTATGVADPVLTNNRSVNVPDVSVGFIYRLPKYYSAGLSIMHLTRPNVAFDPNDNDSLPMSVKFGLNYRGLLSNIALQYETRQSPIDERDHRFTIGAERWFPWLLVGNLGARAALTTGSRDLKQVSAGFSYRNRRFELDYGFSLPLNSIVSTVGMHRLSFSVYFGGIEEPDESEELILEAMRRLKYGQLKPEKTKDKSFASLQRKRKLVRRYLAETRRLAHQARYKEAFNILNKALVLDPKNATILRDFSRLNFVASTVKSLPDYQIDSVEGAWHEGILAYLSYDDAAAVEKVSKALSLNPASREIDSFLTHLELSTGLKRSVMTASVEKSTSLPVGAGKKILVEKSPFDFLKARASLAVEEERYQEAIELNRKVLNQSPDELSAWENLGISYFALKDYERSMEAFERAYSLEKNPVRRKMVKTHLASIKKIIAKKGRGARKKAKISTGISILTPEMEKLYNRGLDLYNLNRLEEARDIFKKVLKSAPGYRPAANALKRVEAEIKKRE